MKYNEHNYYVYILASKKDGTLYIGVTRSLFSRIWQHKLISDPKSFTARYKINRLVYFEPFKYICSAIAREKQLKRWHRQWKINLIEESNPNWSDLFAEAEND